MVNDLTFETVINYVKSSGDSELIDSVDNLLTVLLLFSAVALPTAPVAGIAVGLLTAKSELTKAGQSVYRWFTQKREEDPQQRLNRMEAAFCLISYTAFFEALDSELPEIVKLIRLTDKERLIFSERAVRNLLGPENTSSDESQKLNLHSYSIRFPHTTESMKTLEERLAPLYELLAQGFQNYLEKLSVWSSGREFDRNLVEEKVSNLPEKALEMYNAHYFSLCTHFPEFQVWSNLYGNKSIEASVQNVFESLVTVPRQTYLEKSNQALTALESHYLYDFARPILYNQLSQESISEGIVFPKRSEIYIAQSFKSFRYSGIEKLEDKDTWNSVKSRKDLGSFLLSYLNNRHSHSAPLVILGHPGSGKSLLTRKLSSMLVGKDYTPIRVELRNVNANDSLNFQVEEQIRMTVGSDVTWAEMKEHFDKRPPILILDGFDELLQASGKVFADYLQKTKQFQENQHSLGYKPVVTIITSRLTLIGKARIPKGTTFIRLEEFDSEQQQKWIKVWNEQNKYYYQKHNIKQFELPDDNKILQLAKQPLLLLMLAIFDSENNLLRKLKELDRTLLYNNLLRRFIEREQVKTDFNSKSNNERSEILTHEMKRLGAAAVGMFNRRKLHFNSQDLNNDLALFKVEHKATTSDGIALSEGDILIGNFFFIHVSQNKGKDDSNNSDKEKGQSFEFLHGTFGEFLTADFILNQLVREIRKLIAFRNAKDLHEERAFLSKEPLPSHLLACLVYAPLFSRPEILGMMREWLIHFLPSQGIKLQDFKDELHFLVDSQLKLLLSSQEAITTVKNKFTSTFQELPLMGHAAIFSNNLIVLRTVLLSNPYVFKENEIKIHDDGSHAWDRLLFLWRSWFSIERLNVLNNIITTTRESGEVHIVSKNQFEISSGVGKLEVIKNVSAALGDSTSLALVRIILNDAYRDDVNKNIDIQRILSDDEIELNALFHLKNLRSNRYQMSRSQLDHQITEILNESYYITFDSIEIILDLSAELAEIILNNGLHSKINIDLIYYLVRLVDLKVIFWPPRIYKLLLELAHTCNHVELSDYLISQATKSDTIERSRNKRILRSENIMVLTHAFLESNDKDALFDFYQRELQPYFSGKDIIEISPELMVIYLKLARGFQDISVLEKFYKNFSNLILNDKPDRLTSPKLGVEYLRLARDFGDISVLEKFLSYFNYQFSTRRDTAIIPSDLAIEYLRLARDFGDISVLEKFYDQFFRHKLNPNNISIASPDLAVEYLRLARDFGDISVLEKFYDQFFRHKLNPNNISIASPDLAVEYLRLARDFGDPKATTTEIWQNLLRNIDNLPLRIVKTLKSIALEQSNTEAIQVIQDHFNDSKL